MYIKPVPGIKTRDPVKKDLLPDEGRHVPDDSLYWHRRLRDNDVVEAGPPETAPDAAPPEPVLEKEPEAAPSKPANAVRKTPQSAEGDQSSATS